MIYLLIDRDLINLLPKIVNKALTLINKALKTKTITIISAF